MNQKLIQGLIVGLAFVVCGKCALAIIENI